jgi:hypothetical protein
MWHTIGIIAAFISAFMIWFTIVVLAFGGMLWPLLAGAN